MTTRRQLPLVRALLVDLQPTLTAGVVWVTDADVLDMHAIAADLGFSARTAMDGAEFERGVLFLVPPRCSAWFEGTSLRLGARAELGRGAVDRFLRSMSAVWGSRSLAVVSRFGPDEDGADGLGEVSSAQGVAIGPTELTVLGDADSPPASSLGARADGEPISQFGALERAAVEARGLPRMSRLFLLSPHVLAVARSACNAAIRNAEEGARLKVWVPGCRTGELVYAMAMLLAEAAVESQAARPRLQIFGTDTDEAALAVARAARYPVGAALGMDPVLRGRYTFDIGDTIRISEQLRQVCVFSRHDVRRDVPLSGMDLVVCDRILEGLDDGERNATAEALHFALKAGGLLCSLEHTTSFPVDRFAPVEQGYSRVSAARSPLRRLTSRVSARVRPPPIARLLARQRSLRSPADIRYLEPANGNGTIFIQIATLRAANRALRQAELSQRAAHDKLRVSASRLEREHVALQKAYARLEALVQAVRVPLIACDRALRVHTLSEEASAAFTLRPEDRGANLAELLPRLPGGPALADAARRVALGGEAQNLTVRTDRELYRVAISACSSDGVVLVFTNLTALAPAST